jgi:hypothetical protein
MHQRVGPEAADRVAEQRRVEHVAMDELVARVGFEFGDRLSQPRVGEGVVIEDPRSGPRQQPPQHGAADET